MGFVFPTSLAISVVRGLITFDLRLTVKMTTYSCFFNNLGIRQSPKYPSGILTFGPVN